MKKKNGGSVTAHESAAEQEPEVDELALMKAKVGEYVNRIHDARAALADLESEASEDIARLVELAPKSDFRFGDRLIRFRSARDGSGWTMVDLNKRQVV